jgi:secreted trypsin-like serine protease
MMSACPRDPFDELIARCCSRRMAIAGLCGGLVARAVQDGWAALAKSKAGKGRTHGKQQRQKKRAGADKGVSPEIVGGSFVPIGKYPFQVALSDQRYGKKGFQRQFCGGSLIDAWHVLTAAHCVKGRTTSEPKNLRVVVGITQLNSREGETRRIAQITIHPEYNGKQIRNDAAVLRLDAPIDVTRYLAIRPANPGDARLEAPGTMLTVTGWGSIRQHVAGKKNRNKPPKYSHGLREVEVPVVADDECSRDFGRKHGGKFSAEAMICAGQDGLDACAGDSGGPLFAETAEGFVQVGIVSWGSGCAAPGQPGVYTRVSAVHDFIQNAIRDVPSSAS